MQFKDVQQHHTLYILDKKDMVVRQGKVVNKSFPHAPTDYKSGNTMMIDFTIEVAGRTAAYEIPENLSVTYAPGNNLILSVDKQGLAAEVENMKNMAEQILQSVDEQKMILDKSKSLLADLNPAYKEKQETDSRLSKIEDSVKRMETMFSQFMQSQSNSNGGNNGGNNRK